MRIVSLIGGGGKTTTMLTLAKELRSGGALPIVTTTTRILSPRETGAGDEFVTLLESAGRESFHGHMISYMRGTSLPGSIPVAASDMEGGDHKLTGFSIEELSRMARLMEAEEASSITGEPVEAGESSLVKRLGLERVMKGECVILIEADGSKGRSLKAYAPHEPIVHPGSDRVYIVMGLDSLGKRASEYTIHRFAIFLDRMGRSPGAREGFGEGSTITVDTCLEALGGCLETLKDLERPVEEAVTVVLTRRAGYDEPMAVELYDRVSKMYRTVVI